MKNMFKKAIAAASAAVLCAVPMTSSLANAATASNAQQNTYRVYYDLKTLNTYMKDATVELGTPRRVDYYCGSKIGNLGGYFRQTGTAGDWTWAVMIFHTDQAVITKGTILKSTYTLPIDPAVMTNYARPEVISVGPDLPDSVIKMTTVKVGDVNDSVGVTSADLSELEKIIGKNHKSKVSVGTNKKYRAADIDNNDVVDENDYTILDNYLKGYIRDFSDYAK